MNLNLRLFIIMLFCSVGFRGFAQQNLFNVPSADITEKGKIFIQEQINLFADNMASNTTICAGLGRNCEIGVNILGLTYDYQAGHFTGSKQQDQPVYPSYGLNAQKQLLKFKQYSISLGAQLLLHTSLSNAEWYGYLNNKLELQNIKLIAGLFCGNNNYFGKESRMSNTIRDIGFQSGLEYQIIRHKLSLQADFISGRTALSNLIAGAAFNISQHWIFSAGYQIANHKSSSSNGVIFEITFLQ